jgi:2-dehydro-3-deoxy-D-arabinonate dehydratase
LRVLRFHDGAGVVSAGVLRGDRVSRLPVDSCAELWRMRRADLASLLDRYSADDLRLADATLLPPVDGRTVVWGCGVTYVASQQARIEESTGWGDVYRAVYDADRPELFFKSVPWHVVGDGQVIAVRGDSTLDVPEPELAVVVNRFGEIVGLTICDDVSSRSIEAANPLYLPQAKIYLGSCAVGPMVRPAWEVADLYDLTIEMTIWRGAERAWHGTANTSLLHRRFDELVEHLVRADVYPDGAVLSTGTCLVPEEPFTLLAGDVVRVAVAEVGTLTTGVVEGLADMAWLADGTDPPAHLRPQVPHPSEAGP